MNEQHFFLNGTSGKIYCVEYFPETRFNNNHGVILCKPLWGERIRTHHIFTNLARSLRQDGFRVITCDYYGDGNSGGETIDLTFDGMVGDINKLYSYFSTNCSITSYSLMGLRVGANIAVAAGNYVEHLRKIILVEPVSTLAGYIMDVLRANLTSQMTAYKKIIKDRKTLIDDINNDIPVNADGFLIGKKLWESFNKTDSAQTINTNNCPITLIELVDKKRMTNSTSRLDLKFEYTKYQAIEKEFVWTDWKFYIQRPPVFFQTIRNELLDIT